MESEREKVLMLEHMRKITPPPFLLKTYTLVEDPATDAVISWNDDGTAFVVWQPAEFSRDLLPTLFKHSNFSSFIRQLNTYGFHKIATNRWEFSNDMFRKGERDKLCEIRRKKTLSNKPQPNMQLQSPPPPPSSPKDHSGSYQDQRSPSTSSSSQFTILIDENKRLRQENDDLNSELVAMKKKCKELFDLATIYSKKGERSVGVEENNNHEDPKLFGVRLTGEGDMEKKREGGRIMENDRIVVS